MQAPQLETDAPIPAEPSGRDRRVWPRIPAADLQQMKVRLATGGEVTLIDLSRAGARLESIRRMLPNSSISLTLVTPDTTVVLTGVVVRSRIVRLESGLGYDVAVAFNDLLQQVPERPDAAAAREAAAPQAAEAPSIDAGMATTIEVGSLDEGPDSERRAGTLADDTETTFPLLPDPPAQAMLRITAEVDATEQLRDLLDGNGW